MLGVQNVLHPVEPQVFLKCRLIAFKHLAVLSMRSETGLCRKAEGHLGSNGVNKQAHTKFFKRIEFDFYCTTTNGLPVVCFVEDCTKVGSCFGCHKSRRLSSKFTCMSNQ